MFTGACKITGNGLAVGCQLFYHKIYVFFVVQHDNTTLDIKDKRQEDPVSRLFYNIYVASRLLPLLLKPFKNGSYFVRIYYLRRNYIP